MTAIKVGAEAEQEPVEVVHATIVANSKPGWRTLTPEEIAAGCTGNPDDPYDSIGERAEGCFVGVFVTKLLAKVGIIADPEGFASTYREWHIFLRGFHSGFNTALFAKFEKCPDMWEDEAQYYEMAQEIGYVTKIVVSVVGSIMVGGIGGLAAFSGIIPAGAVGIIQNLTAVL